MISASQSSEHGTAMLQIVFLNLNTEYSYLQTNYQTVSIFTHKYRHRKLPTLGEGPKKNYKILDICPNCKWVGDPPDILLQKKGLDKNFCGR